MNTVNSKPLYGLAKKYSNLRSIRERCLPCIAVVCEFIFHLIFFTNKSGNERFQTSHHGKTMPG